MKTEPDISTYDICFDGIASWSSYKFLFAWYITIPSEPRLLAEAKTRLEKRGFHINSVDDDTYAYAVVNVETGELYGVDTISELIKQCEEFTEFFGDLLNDLVPEYHIQHWVVGSLD